MLKFIAIAAVALCAVAVFAQHPRHCNAPSEFEAHAFQMDPKEQFFRRGRFAYDSREERVALLEDVVNGTDQEYFHTIHLWRERTTYRINLKTKTCTTEELRHRFHRIEIPRDAHFVGEAIIGTNAFENSGLLTTHWNAENKTEKWDWYGVFTDRDIGCVPVADEFHDHEVGRVNTQYFDVVLGIADPNVFIPPSSCKRSDDNNDAEPVIDIKKETAGDSYTFAHGVAPKKSDAVNAKSGSWALFKQCDPSWANVQLGTCSLTICQAGCAMSSTAMILRTKGIDTNPDVLNSWLKSNGGYESGCDIVWSAVDRFGKTSFQGIEHADYATICSGISAGHGIIGNVRGGTHWVLLTGCDGKNNFYVNDPGFPSTMYSYGDVLQEAVYH